MAYLLAIEATGAVCGVALVQDSALAGAVRLAHGLNLSGSLLHAAEWLLGAARAIAGAGGRFRGGCRIRRVHGAENRRDARQELGARAGQAAGRRERVRGVRGGRCPTARRRWSPCPPAATRSTCSGCCLPTRVCPSHWASLPSSCATLLGEWLAHNNGSPRVRGEPAGGGAVHASEGEALQAVGAAHAREWLAAHLPRLRWRTIDAPPVEGVAQVGWRRFLAGETMHPFALTPLYIQPPSIHPKGAGDLKSSGAR
jgi:hypothetical protein